MVSHLMFQMHGVRSVCAASQSGLHVAARVQVGFPDETRSLVLQNAVHEFEFLNFKFSNVQKMTC